MISGAVRDLKVWQQSMELVDEVYRLTRAFPTEEVYGLSAQMRRSAVSIPSNIAEGRGRFSSKELVQFLYHARGSLLELETQLEIATRLGYLEASQAERSREKIGSVARLLNGLLNAMKAL
jgi:four helix bundle protein